MKKVYVVDLTPEERDELLALLKGGRARLRKTNRARILLLADEGRTDQEVTEVLLTSVSTVERTRKRFVEGGLGRALEEEAPRPGGERKLDGRQEAHLVALACSDPPEGRQRWTMQLLADRLAGGGRGGRRDKRRDGAPDAQKGDLKPWVKKRWCIPSVGAEFVWRMEDVLDLYEEPYDPKKPVVCFDEMPHQLVEEVRVPLPVGPGRPARHDYEYRRRGTANLFVCLEPKGNRRHVDVTERRTAIDFASQMRRLVDERYPEAEVVRVVLDNLNTHTGASLYRAFEPWEARRVLRRLEFHHTPKHASWLNQAEVEFSVLSRQCLSGRRIPDEETLTREIETWEVDRNERGETVQWRFTAQDARRKLSRLYPAQP